MSLKNANGSLFYVALITLIIGIIIYIIFTLKIKSIRKEYSEKIKNKIQERKEKIIETKTEALYKLYPQ